MHLTNDDLPHSDPLIEEVRALRRGISERFGNDVDRLCAHLREVQRQHGGRVVSRSAKGARSTQPSGMVPKAPDTQ